MIVHETSFDKALKFTLKWEGGWSNDPQDPGGETNFGITQNTYNKFLSDRKLPFKSVKKITKEEARDIYLTYYWLAADCDDLEEPMAIAAFDFAVNSGPSRAKQLAKLCCYDLKHYLEVRREFLRKLNKPRFINGWLNRVNDLEKYISEVSHGSK